MRVTFYGVRGSTPTPGPSTARYGGNTSCVEVRLGDGSLLVLDAGTGLRELGKVLLAEGHADPIHLLLSHVHWDHILGLPFFGPVWQSGTNIRIYPVSDKQRNFCQQLAIFDGVHFPVQRKDVPSKLDVVDIDGE